MLYPKQTRKKRKKHKASILHTKDGTCLLCMLLNNDYRMKGIVQEHHIYNGPNRKISEEQGFKAYLCLEHHTAGAAAVHNNHENMRYLQRYCQRVYETEHTREEFMELIGRNYLDEETEKHAEVQVKNLEMPEWRLVEEVGK